MRVWITRDKETRWAGDSCLWVGKPKLMSDGTYDSITKATAIDQFEHMTPSCIKSRFGFTPRKGSCKQYELSLKEIK